MPALDDIDEAPHPAFDDAFLAPAAISADPLEALGEVFGFDGFRPLQEEAVTATLAGRDVLVVMPTGAGKSLCFQLPALMAEGGVTVVVSPLIALMHDQVDALARRSPDIGRLSGCLTSLQGLDEQRTVLGKLRTGNLRLLYVAPERFRSQPFLDALRSTHVNRFVVDEAHCISEWGHDFRPDYLSLLPVLEMLGRPPVLAATATATVGVQASIAANLALRDPAVIVGGFNRPNLHWSVHRCPSEKARAEKLTAALPKLAGVGGSGLIYAPTRKACEEIAEIARLALAPLNLRAGVYHAGMAADDRTAAQQAWLAGTVHVLVATSAFGMGIDKPDVRYVIHAGYPDSLESYYQEAGRAGRDGRRSRCVILSTPGDWRTREWFLNNENLEPADVRKLYSLLKKYADGNDVRTGKNDLARDLDASLIKLRLALAELDRAQLVCRMAETTDEIALTLGPNPWADKVLVGIASDLKRQHEERARRLAEMSDYCRSTNCRRRSILAYFGDHDTVTQEKGCCDNCDRPPQAVSAAAAYRGPAAPMPESIPAGDFHAILQGLDALRPSLGRARLGKLLRGAASGGESAALLGSPVHGCMRGASRDKVNAFLDSLVAAGFLRIGDETEYHVCTVTAAGRDAWQARTVVSAIVAPGSRVKSPSTRSATAHMPGGDDLFEALRTWRAGLAKERAVPPYVIFGDKVLREIADTRPSTQAELLAISGVGERKLEQFGDNVLAIVSAHPAPP